MKITGFTFIRNAIKYDYPIVEAIKSILPICNEVIVAVGNSEDATRALIENIDPQKVKIIDTIWDDSKRDGGRVLAEETNKALNAVSGDCDWCLYVQGDEVLHERYHENLYKAMEQYKAEDRVDGLLLKYMHFYGSYNHVGTSPRWYSHEIRVIKPNRGIYSYKDAQGFRKGENDKLRVKEVEAVMYHYGWVKPPVTMQQKWERFASLYHDEEWMKAHSGRAEYDYDEGIDVLQPFTGTHPAVMQERVERMQWQYHYDYRKNKLSTKNKLKRFVERYMGINLSYRNYKKV